MLVKDWMSKEVIVLDENASIMKASQIMKENNIRRIPVVRGGRLVGIISDRDIKEATPSKATALDVHELYYLLAEVRVKDIMTPDPITVRPEDTVEYAAVLMLENRISGLPVVDEKGQVVGIITQTDTGHFLALMAELGILALLVTVFVYGLHRLRQQRFDEMRRLRAERREYGKAPSWGDLLQG